MKAITSFLLVFCFTCFSSFSQIGIGEWREHLPFRKAKEIIYSSENIFCLTESGVFRYSLVSNEIVVFTKTKGLSDSEVSAIGWSEEESCLLIGYSNGNLDIIKDGELVNLPEIKKSNLVESKQINKIATKGTVAYLSTNFGIVSVNLDKLEIADTYFIGDNGAKIKVNDLEISDSDIWAATEFGLYKASLSSLNLSDFNSWTHIDDLPYQSRECTSIQLVGEKVYLVRSLNDDSDELYVFKNGSWSNFSLSFAKIHSLRSFSGDLWVVQSDKIRIFNASDSEIQEGDVSENSELRDAVQIDGRMFLADYLKSLVEWANGQSLVIKPDGPMDSEISDLHSVGEKTWAVSGDRDDLYLGKQKKGEVYLFQNQEWVNFTSDNVSELASVFDIRKLASDKRNENILYAASWGHGIVVLEGEQLREVWNDFNSPLDSKGVGDLASDDDGNVWILDVDSNQPVKVYSRDGQWASLGYSSLSRRKDLEKIICLSNGDKWVMRSTVNSLFAFNENSTIDNQDDDVSATFLVKDENNSVISSQVYDIAEDLDGNVWVGGSNGVAVYSEPGNIFRSGDFYAYRPLITIDGTTQYLLSSEKVLSIAVDGGNQKWLGTENSGVFLISEDGGEQLAHFNTENSPLPSNRIEQISVNPGTGEVFFLTDKGLISYKGKVTDGADNYSRLYVYPNPVREDYHGDIVVSGLVANSIVKITDVSGNLVWEGKSTGGQFIWDGKNFNGSRVHTGVYLIFCSNSDGSESKVIKLLFIH